MLFVNLSLDSSNYILKRKISWDYISNNLKAISGQFAMSLHLPRGQGMLSSTAPLKP